MLISIVTPSLNQAAFLPQAIDSVLGQVGADFEYRVFDGGSTDGSVEILNGYSDRLGWESRPDRGQTAAINRGWQAASGDVLAWLNADDVYFPGALAKVTAFFQTDPDVDWVYGACDYLDAEGHSLGAYPTRPFDLTRLMLGAVNFIPQPSTFVRRRLVEQAGYLDENLHYVMDFDYWLRIGLKAPAGFIQDRLSGLRIHPEAKSLRSLPGFGDELVGVYRRLFDRPDLPRELGRLRRPAQAQASYLAADATFWGGDSRRGRMHVATAWSLGFPRWPRGLPRLTALLVLGSTGRRLAGGRRGNPYLVGSRR